MQWKEDYAAALGESTGPVGETKLVNRNKSKLQVPRGQYRELRKKQRSPVPNPWWEGGGGTQLMSNFTLEN